MILRVGGIGNDRKVKSFIRKLLFLSLLTRKRFIFLMLLMEQKNNFRIKFFRFEQALGGACKVTSLENSLTRYSETGNTSGSQYNFRNGKLVQIVLHVIILFCNYSRVNCQIV